MIVERFLGTVAGVLVLLVSGNACPANFFEPGLYEQLMIAVDGQHNLSGFYHEVQGKDVVKECSFFVSGRATGSTIPVMTWNEERFPGTLVARPDGVELKVGKAREYPGCGLVILPEISEGIELTRTERTHWKSLWKIVNRRAFLYSKPCTSSRSTIYIVKNGVVGVSERSGTWLYAEFPNNGKIASGWIPAADAEPIEAAPERNPRHDAHGFRPIGQPCEEGAR